jgi:hypothetical protein
MTRKSLALRIAAAWAEVATLLIYQEVTTLWTLPCQVYGWRWRRALKIFLRASTLGLLLQYSTDGIGTRKNGMPVLQGNGGAADTAKMLYDSGSLYP